MAKEKIEVAAQAFALPTYEKKKRAKMGALSVAVPDDATAPKANEEFAFLAYSKAFKGGATLYKDAPFSVNCKTAAVQKAAQLAALWDGDAAARKAAFCAMLKHRLDLMERRYEVCYLSLAKSLDVVYAQIGENDKGEEEWCSYLALFFHGDTLYQVQVYINAPRDDAAFMTAVEQWVSKVQVARAAAEKKPAQKKPAVKKSAPKTAAKTPAPKKAAAPKAAWQPRGSEFYRSRWVRK